MMNTNAYDESFKGQGKADGPGQEPTTVDWLNRTPVHVLEGSQGLIVFAMETKEVTAEQRKALAHTARPPRASSM